MKMTNVVSVASLMISLLVSGFANAQGIDSGCFHYGPNPGCDLSQHPPSINTGGFHYGPQSVGFAAEVLSPRLQKSAALTKAASRSQRP